MSLATKATSSPLQRLSILKTLLDRVSANAVRRQTIRALKACRPHDLQDAGIIPHDITEMESGSASEAVDKVCRNSGQRAGNW